MKLTYDIDLAFSEVYDSLGEALEVLAKRCPSAWVRINHLNGSGGGWPDLTIMVDESDVIAFCEWYGGEGATPESLEIDCGLEPSSVN